MRVALTCVFAINILLATVILVTRARWLNKNDTALRAVTVGQSLSGLLPVPKMLPRWTSRPADNMFIREAWSLGAFIALQLAGIILVQLV